MAQERNMMLSGRDNFLGIFLYDKALILYLWHIIYWYVLFLFINLSKSIIKSCLIAQSIIFEDIHNSWLYCFTNPVVILQIHRSFCETILQNHKSMKQYNQELCISSIIRCYIEMLQLRSLKRTLFVGIYYSHT